MVRNLSPEKKDTLLRAALHLFVSQGVSNTSTAQIAREAGVAAGTLFLYFPTRQALLDELILDIGRGQSGAVQKALSPTLSARQAFFTIWQATLHWFMENLEAYLYLQQVRDSGLISPAAVQESAGFFGYYYAAIQQGAAEGSLKPYPLDLVGNFLYHDLVAVMSHIRLLPDPSAREEIIRQGFEIFWDGIKSAPESNGKLQMENGK